MKMHISKKSLGFYVTLLVAAFTFILASECNAQRGFGRLPRRQQQIENRVRQVSPSTSPAADQQSTPATEKKAEETPAPAVNEKAEEKPAPATEKKAEEKPTPAAEKKAEEKPAPAAEEKAEEKTAPAAEEKAEEKPAPATEKKTRRSPWNKKAKDSPAPAVKDEDEEKPNAESSIIKEEKTDSENVPDLEEDLSANAPKSSSDPLHQEAVEKVLADPNVPEEAKTALKQATKEDIQKSVREATAEVEADNKNEHIDGVVENSRKEVDEDSIETAVNEVLDSSEETLQEEQKRNTSAKEDEEVDDSIPDSVNQILKDFEKETEGKAEKAPALDDDEDEAEEAPALDDDEEKTEEDSDLNEDEDEAKAPSDAKVVKLESLDQELKIPENATFEQLHAFLIGLDSLSPADLEQTNQDVMMNQMKTFIEKVFQAKLAASNQMLTLENLTDEQWREGVSWKVQSLAGLFQLDGSKMDEMSKFVEEIRPKAPKDVMWKIESILIQMELAQITEEPTPEELKKYVNRMLEHTQKGIDENCVSLDFVFATVQMVVLTEDALPKEESKAFFESAIKTLNSSEMPRLKEMAKFLQKILDQREIVGKTPDLTLETYDGKTVKTADFVGKTLLIYCFQISSRDQLQDLGLVYQIFLAFHDRGLEVIGIVPEEKTDAMDELLKQIPWPMVFEGKDAENSPIEKLCVPTLPTKVLVNKEGKIENANIQPMALLKYLEAVYGPVSKPSDDEKAEDAGEAPAADAEEDDAEEETEVPDLSEDEADEMPDVESEDAEDDEDGEDAEEDEETEALDPPADEAEKTPAEKVKEKVKEKADELELDLDSIL